MSDSFGKKSARKNRTPAPESVSCSPWWDNTILHLFGIALLGALIYANTLHVPFVFDDDASILRNPVIKNLGNFLTGASGYHYNPRRFVGYLSFALNYRLGADNVFGYHLVNLAIHLLNAWLVYALVRITFRTPQLEAWQSHRGWLQPRTMALVAATLFVAHPVQTQAVTYVVQRLASLATLFYLLTMVLYGWGRIKSQSVYYGLALVMALLAMHTKEIAFTLPLVILLYEFLFFSGKGFSRLMLVFPLLALLCLLPLWLLKGATSTGELLSDVNNLTRVQTQLPRMDYLLTQMRVIVTYLRLLILPVHQNLDYEYPVYHSLLQVPVFLSLLLLLAILGLGVYLVRKSGDRELGTGISKGLASSLFPVPCSQCFRLAAFGIFWFFITLSVESSVIPIADVIFEHRLYLPSVGVSMVAAAAVASLVGRISGRVLTGGIALIILLLSVATWQRNQLWRDPVLLWQDVVAKSPRKDLPRTNLGKALYQQGRTDEALEQLQVAVRINPVNPVAHNNLGSALLDKGRVDEAIAEFRRALELRPGLANGHFNLGLALIRKGAITEAMAELQHAVSLEPDHLEARHNLAVAGMLTGAFDLAVAQAREMIARRPGDARAFYLLGLGLRKQGQAAEAIRAYQRAVELNPGFSDAHNDLGVTLAEAGELDRAITSLQRAIELEPGRVDCRENLAKVYDLKGWKDRAAQERRSAAGLGRR